MPRTAGHKDTEEYLSIFLCALCALSNSWISLCPTMPAVFYTSRLLGSLEGFDHRIELGEEGMVME